MPAEDEELELGADEVLITHPDLPNATSVVKTESLQTWKNLGWASAETEPAPTTTAPADEPSPPGESTESLDTAPPASQKKE